ncbi:MAG: APC family permease [Acidimicrobiales bacterium]
MSTQRGGLAADSAGFVHAMAQSMAVGPLFSAALFGGIIAGIAGSAGPFVLVVSTAGVVAVSVVIATFARRHPNAGSIYGFFKHATRSKEVANFGAGIYFYGLLWLGAGGIYIGFGVLFQEFAVRYLGFDPPWWAPALLAVLAVAAVNVVGVKPSVRAQLVILAVSAVPFLALAAKVLAVGGAHGNTWRAFDPSAPSAGSVFSAFLFCIILYLGFELSSALGEEAKRASTTIPWAVVATVAAVGAFFILMQYVGTIGFGVDAAAKAWGASPNGLAVLGGRYLGSWAEVWIYLAVLLDILGVALGFTVSAARGLYSLGRDGVLPRWLGTVTRRRTPARANATIVVGAFALVLGFLWSPLQTKFEGFVITAGVGALLMLLVYVGLGATLMAQASPRRGRLVRIVVAATAITVAGLGIYGSVTPFPTGPARWEIWFALIGVGAAAVLTTAVASRRRSGDAPVAAVAPGDAGASRIGTTRGAVR